MLGGGKNPGILQLIFRDPQDCPRLLRPRGVERHPIRTIACSEPPLARLDGQFGIDGAMGMTEELKVSHSFRRLTMITQQFGDADHHLERFAQA